MSLDPRIIKIIEDARTIAVVGCSPDPHRDSYYSAREATGAIDIVHEEAAELARAAGIAVVMNECLRAKHKQLQRLERT